MKEIEDLENTGEGVEHDRDLEVTRDRGHDRLVVDHHFRLVSVDREVHRQKDDLQDLLHPLELVVAPRNEGPEVGVSRLAGKC